MTVRPAQHQQVILLSGSVVTHLCAEEVIGAVSCRGEGDAFVVAVERGLDDERPVRAGRRRRAHI